MFPGQIDRIDAVFPIKINNAAGKIFKSLITSAIVIILFDYTPVKLDDLLLGHPDRYVETVDFVTGELLQKVAIDNDFGAIRCVICCCFISFFCFF
ncbi:hypothetical protein EDM60_23235 [Brevibacillus parabrevis]|nr:hypothetical protein EDM60_23235 [Brevibacillus parabrevis]